MDTAVLFIVFNRLDTAKVVFDSIREAKPKRLYISSDGPRDSVLGEIIKVEEVRNYILNNIDWPCDVYTKFEKYNLGCKIAVSSAIDWLFSKEECGIIIEDDVVPTQDFYPYCEEMLNIYANDSRIGMITGMNHEETMNTNTSIFFSEHFVIWGWATWRRAWLQYDVKMSDWEYEKRNIRYKAGSRLRKWHYTNTFDSLERDYTDTWDIQWVYTCYANNMLCVTPSVNLVSNIGVEGTHGNGVTSSHFKKTYDYRWDLKLPKNIIASAEYDNRLHEKITKKAFNFYIIKKILKRIGLFNTFKKILNK